MSKFVRIMDVLDLYSETIALLTAEEVADKLQVSRPTAFRYMRELSAAGFLANYSGRYSLGARIITLDYRIRASDPVLKSAGEAMRALCAETACSAILCRMYNDDIINVHYELGYQDASLSFFGRGRPLPLFRGSASKTMLANLPLARQKKIFDGHQKEAGIKAMGASWPAFSAYLAAIRKAGHYISNQEVDQGTMGIGAPIIVPRVGLLGTISLVFAVERLPMLNCDGLASMLKNRIRDLAQQLRSLRADDENQRNAGIR